MKIHEDGTYEWHHKDAHRTYWAICAWKTGESEPAWEGAPENEKDEEWAYRIYKGQSSPNTEVGFGHFWTQGGVAPDVEDFFNHWLSSMLPIAAGFAKWPHQWYGLSVMDAEKEQDNP